MHRKLCLLVALFFCAAAFAQSYAPSPENLQAREDFARHRLGIFLHWGIYATYGQGEWYLQTGKLDNASYAEAAESFNPVKFDAAAWARAFFPPEYVSLSAGGNQHILSKLPPAVRKLPPTKPSQASDQTPAIMQIGYC